VRLLDRWHGDVREVDVRQPTLDDVFLQLTGHAVDSADAETTEPTRAAG